MEWNVHLGFISAIPYNSIDVQWNDNGFQG